MDVDARVTVAFVKARKGANGKAQRVGDEFGLSQRNALSLILPDIGKVAPSGGADLKVLAALTKSLPIGANTPMLFPKHTFKVAVA